MRDWLKKEKDNPEFNWSIVTFQQYIFTFYFKALSQISFYKRYPNNPFCCVIDMLIYVLCVN